MKKIISKTAFSLLELIIASVLVVIVILGIFSINSVLSNNNQDYGQRYFVRSETQTTLNHILNNASMAIGSATNITIPGVNTPIVDQGVVFGNDQYEGWSDPYSLCIHQDVSSLTPDTTTPNSPPSTSPSYNGSRWLCYTWCSSSNNCTISGSATYQIWYCAMSYNINEATRGASNCNSAGNAVYLGTAQSNPIASASFTSASGFSITVNNCLDNTLASGTCGSPNNPNASVSGNIFPTLEGMPTST